VGTDDEKVEEALGLIRASSAAGAGPEGQRTGMAFVLNVARFEQL